MFYIAANYAKILNMKIFSALFALLLSFGLHAQVIDGGIEGLRLMTKVSEDLEKVHGSPYWFEEFQFGTISIKDKSPIKGFLRYDVQSEIIEIKTDQNSDEIYTLGNRSDVSYILNNKRIIADQISSDNGRVSGLFIEHFNGENYRLLEKMRVDISEAVQAKSSYESDKPARMEISSNFYLISDNKTAKEIRIKHRDLKKMFSSKHAKKFLSDNKIREVEDLVAFLEYMEGSSSNL